MIARVVVINNNKELQLLINKTKMQRKFKKTKLFLTALTFTMLITSCQEELVDEAEIATVAISKQPSNNFYNIPYSSESELSKFQEDDEIVNYNLARKIALLELNGSGLKKKLKWEGNSLAEIPVLIYGLDSKPKYYDFIVLDAEKQEIGTVTVEARKNSGAIINELRKNIRDYNSLYPKSDTGMKLIKDWDGKFYIGLIDKPGIEPSMIIDPDTGETVEGMHEYSDEEILEKVYKTLDNQAPLDKTIQVALENDIDTDLLEIEKPNIEAKKESLLVDMKRAHEERDFYWKVIDEHADSLIATPDKEIIEQSSKFLGAFFNSIFGNTTSSTYEINDYANNIPFNSGGWCGPWAMNWIHNTNTNNSDYDHFESWASTLNPVGVVIAAVDGSKPMFPEEMFISMLIASRSRVLVNPFFSTGRSSAYNYIKNTYDPVVILTEGGSHWKVGYGTYRTAHFAYYNYYFACQDNGYLNIDINDTYMKADWFMLFLKVNELVN